MKRKHGVWERTLPADADSPSRGANFCGERPKNYTPDACALHDLL